MAQINSGIRKLLSTPFIYDFFQTILGAKMSRQIYVNEYIKPSDYCRVLDIGCGKGEILEYLPITVDYHGYDLSPEYISAAKKRYGNRGTWHNESVMDMQMGACESFDIVMANGLHHHLDDPEACQLIKIASKALKPSGRF